jgi:hypothetical protein
MPDDPRATDLFEELNARFFHFIDRLPEPLDRLARQKSTFLGSQEDGEFGGVPELNPVLASTPWLFWESFKTLDDSLFLDIAEGGTFYVLASILLDHLVDGQAEPPEEVALLHQAFYGHGILVYRSTFPHSSAFLGQFERLANDHLAGLAMELETQSSTAKIEMSSLEKMAYGKVSPIVTTIAGLAHALEQPELLEPIESSLKHIAVASQMLDDIGDWQHDISVGHRTYYLAQVVEEVRGGVEDVSIDEVQDAIDEAWMDVEHLQLVIQWLDGSTQAVQGFACPGWLDYVAGYRKLSDEHLTTAIARHLVRKLRPMIKTQSID